MSRRCRGDPLWRASPWSCRSGCTPTGARQPRTEATQPCSCRKDPPHLLAAILRLLTASFRALGVQVGPTVAVAVALNHQARHHQANPRSQLTSFPNASSYRVVEHLLRKSSGRVSWPKPIKQPMDRSPVNKAPYQNGTCIHNDYQSQQQQQQYKS